MVNGVSRRCPHNSCIARASCNIKRGEGKIYCTKHTENGIVYILSTCFSRDTCTRRLAFNVVGIDNPAYCKKHDYDGIMRCSYKACKTQQICNVVVNGMLLYCKQHVHSGTSISGCFSHDTCTRRASFKVVGTKTAAYCEQHAV